MKTVTIHTKETQQKIDGWGTSLCWWANAAGGWTMKGESGKEKREELIKLFFTEEGLDFNIVRYNLGGGDNPEEDRHMFHSRGIPCYRERPDSAFDKEADQKQLWVLKRAYELRKGDLIHEAFVNSPPWWMTRSLCSSGNEMAADENLDSSRYEEFAGYCAEVLEFLRDEVKIKADYFDPMNEPASDYWAKGQRQEGNKVAQGESQSRLLSVVSEKLRERGLDTVLTGTDETNPTVAVQSFRMLSEQVKKDILKKINYHHYARDEKALEALKEIAYPNGFENPSYALWMDEVCYGDGSEDMDLAKNLVTAIAADLNTAHACGWVIWQAMDTISENIENRCHWGLVEGMYQDPDRNELEGILDVSHMGYRLGDYEITTQYYVMGHYSKYIKKDYRILENDGADFNCVCAISPDHRAVIAVLYNDEACEQTVSMNLQDFLPQRAVKMVTSNAKKWETTEVECNLGILVLEPKSVTTVRYEK